MWTVTRARVTGRSHEQSMLPCQDYAEYWALSECLLCVVADGASDACLGEVGASIATESLRQYFSGISFREIQSKDNAQINQEIKRIFDAYITEKSRTVQFVTQSIDYAATMAFIAIYEKYDYYLFGVIGDCTILVFDNNEKFNILGNQELQNSLFRPDFISDEVLQMKLGTAHLSEVKGFILSTDGCAKAGLVSFNGEPVAEIATLIFSYLPKVQCPQIWLEDFISQNFAKFTLDDLSMCIAYRTLGDLSKKKSTQNLHELFESLSKFLQKNANRIREFGIGVRTIDLKGFQFRFNGQFGKQFRQVCGRCRLLTGINGKRQKRKKGE